MARRLLLQCLLFVAFSACWPCRAFGIDGKSLINTHWSTLDSETLMKMGERFGNKPDSALICYTIVANRYDEEQRDEKELIQSVAAFNEIGGLYMYRYYDYPKAYSYMLKAKALAEKHNLRRLMPYIYNNIASIGLCGNGMYEDNDHKYKAMESYKMAFRTAVEIRELKILQPIFINMVKLAYECDKLDDVRNEVKTYAAMNLSDTLFMGKYAKSYCKATMAYLNHDTLTAVRMFNHLPTEARTSENMKARMRLINCLTKRVIFLKMGKEKEALVENDTIVQLSKQYDIPEGTLSAYEAFMHFYQDKNNPQMAEKYELLLLRGSNEINKRAHLYNLDKAEFLFNIERMSLEMKALDRQRSKQSVIIWLVSLLALVLLALLTTVIVNNRRIRRSNRALYDKNVQLLDAEAKQRGQGAEEKYRKSSIDDDYKEMMYKRIVDVMESSQEIFMESFSLASLAELVDGKKNNVSQVINQMYGNNFNAMLNEYRIKEACRRMGDTAHYGNYTVEAIAQSVGFKSRSSFVAVFKRITGLTPSNYQKLAKKAIG